MRRGDPAQLLTPMAPWPRVPHRPSRAQRRWGLPSASPLLSAHQLPQLAQGQGTGRCKGLHSASQGNATDPTCARVQNLENICRGLCPSWPVHPQLPLSQPVVAAPFSWEVGKSLGWPVHPHTPPQPRSAPQGLGAGPSPTKRLLGHRVPGQQCPPSTPVPGTGWGCPGTYTPWLVGLGI